MALHFYINGTVGAKDGTLLSDGDLTSCLTTEGVNVANGVTLSKKINVFVRADEGETWKFCPLYVVGDDASIYDVMVVEAQTIWYDHDCSWLYLAGFFEIKDVNKELIVTIRIKGDDTNNPDTRYKLMIGGTQVA